MLSFFKVKIESYYRESGDGATRSQRSNGLDEATHDPPLSRLARLREAPASIRRVRPVGWGAGRRGAR